MRIIKTIIVLLFGFVILTNFILSDQIKKPFTGIGVTKVSVEVDSSTFRGSCPHTFKFTGYITVNRPCKIKYRWVKNIISPLSSISLIFEKAGTKKVYSSWTLGSNGKSYKNYWQKLEVTSPNKIASSPAVFTLSCTVRPVKEVRLELFPYEISGNIQPAPGTANLAGRKVLVKLQQSGRTLRTKELSLEADGITDYKFKLRLPGRYKVIVEKGPEDSANYANTANICFDGTDPTQIFVDVISRVKKYPDKNFVILNTIAWNRNGICWLP